MKKKKLDILGSCISRVMLINGEIEYKGTYDDRMEIEYFFDKNNMVCSMMPPPFTKEEVDSIKDEELYDKSRLKSLKNGLNKDELDKILSGDADFIVIDLYGLSVDVSCYKNTLFSNNAYEFYNTRLYEKYKDDIGGFNLMNVPTFLWYGYIDLFFEKLLSKYDNDHIVLNRFQTCRKYISEEGTIEDIPEGFKRPFHGKYEYNENVREVEQYIIDKYNPYVIDLSKYFLVDEKHWGNINGVHYQKLFYEEALKKFNKILFEDGCEKNQDKISNLAVSKLLSLNLNDEEYLKYLNEIKAPFVSFETLDNICNIIGYKEVIKNRNVLAELYRVASDLEKELSNKKELNEKVEVLIENIEPSYLEVNKEFIEFIIGFYKEDKTKALEYLERIFLNMINEGDTEWVETLEKMEEYAPDNKMVLSYRLQYFEAVNHQEKIDEYKKKIESLL